MLETLIPLYCLTGFVGSGKTTALLSILRQNPDKKIGVIFTEPPLLHRQNIQENEDISIEMLDNGSLQCSCSEDALAQALASCTAASRRWCLWRCPACPTRSTSKKFWRARKTPA